MEKGSLIFPIFLGNGRLSCCQRGQREEAAAHHCGDSVQGSKGPSTQISLGGKETVIDFGQQDLGKGGQLVHLWYLGSQCQHFLLDVLLFSPR